MHDDSPTPAQIDPWLLRALSHPMRIEILNHLIRVRAGIDELKLAATLDLVVPLAQYHLKVLHDADLVERTRDRAKDGEGRSFAIATGTRSA